MAHLQSSSEARRSVGVIGLGQMGRGIAANLDRAGLLRAAFDIDPEAFGRAGLSADVACLPPSEIGQACDTVLFVVPASPQIEACLSGPDGLLTQRDDRQILVDLTTSYPADTLRLARMAEQAGRAYLDCGMTRRRRRRRCRNADPDGGRRRRGTSSVRGRCWRRSQAASSTSARAAPGTR